MSYTSFVDFDVGSDPHNPNIILRSPAAFVFFAKNSRGESFFFKKAYRMFKMRHDNQAISVWYEPKSEFMLNILAGTYTLFDEWLEKYILSHI